MKKKVLFLLEAFDKGGIEKVTLDIVNNLDPEKYDITVKTFWYGGHCQSLVRPEVKVLPFFFKRYVPGVIRLIEHLPPKWLYRLFVKGKYDVEIAASDGGAAKVIAGSTNKNARKICWVHMDVVERGSKLKEFQNPVAAKKIYGKFHRICCVSRQCLEKFREKFGEFPDIRVVHKPLPDAQIRENAGAFPVEKPSATTFVSVGRLAVEKGFDRLVDASAMLAERGYDFCVRIVGDGLKKDELEKRIAETGLQDRVILAGYAANPYPYVAAGDWYICTSLDEAYPLSVGEAMVLGRPVMGTDCAGIREWLGDQEYGMVLENSTAGIFRGMEAALNMDEAATDLWRKKSEKKAQQLGFGKELAQWSLQMLED